MACNWVLNPPPPQPQFVLTLILSPKTFKNAETSEEVLWSNVI